MYTPLPLNTSDDLLIAIKTESSIFSGREEQWAFHVAVAQYVRGLPVGTPYRKLAALLSNKEHFVVTSNVDGQVPRSFSPEKVFLFQGDLRWWQCSQPCTNEVWNNAQLDAYLVAHTTISTDGISRISEDLLHAAPTAVGSWPPGSATSILHKATSGTSKRLATGNFLRTT